jgi:tRNA modification GTPase
MKTETIAAIASAMTNSGIGIIRISGEDAFDVIDKIYRPQKGNKLLSQCKSHTIHYGHIYDEDEIIDEVMVLLMRAPNSYTREDTVEIDCHGGTLVMRRILEVVLKNGARPAEPGEFTKRAFLNGRIDLSQAESVMDVISSKNDFALKSSMQQLNGALTGKIKEIRGKIIHEIAFIESALDDPEHISIDGYGENLLIIIEKLMQKMNQMIASSENGSLLKEGINTVIVGKPNAGKSSLLNALVGRERAIVTDIAGTTRDVLEEQINLNGITLNIMDTAGIRSTEDVVEKIGVDKALSLVDKADFIIYVVDTSTALDENDEKIIDAIREKKAIILLNKSDLIQVTGEDEIKEKLSGADYKMIAISAKENLGIDVLEETITEMFFHGTISFNDEVYITNIRHKNALIQAVESLKLVKQSVENGMPEDFYSIDLMNAYEELGTIIGEAVEDDLVNEIFSKFCMGK